MRELPFLKPLTRLEDAKVLDPIVSRVHGVVDALLKPRALEDVLHGVPAGHPVHPAIVLVPAGTWIGAAVLDLLPGSGHASRTLIGVGVVAAAPAILTGWVDWARGRREQQRVGIVHAAANESAWVLYAASWLARARGHDTVGKALSFVGFGLVGFGGYLGGHLGYRQALGANHANAVLQRFPAGWHTLGPLDDLPEEQPVRREVAGEALYVLRRGGRIDVLSDVSTHLGESLVDGTLDDPGDASATVTTPLGSVFDIATGEVVHGPATAPAIRFTARINGDLVQVSLPRD
ncbi:DUF2231 domain-containing protein [uncultured Amnibacterium sp.]|uniref:DUF2231 domain-containing protein n=1 Tax=uncultured Amnibacterium sp. TaxID=1631851 RepID=UPI0035C9C33A